MNQEEPTLSIINDAAQAARVDWDAANKRLQTARNAFKNGAVICLKDIQNKQTALKEKLSAAIADRHQVDAEFKAAFEAAGFEKTPAIQKILNRKSDAISIYEALDVALNRLNEEHKPVLVQAASEAHDYDSAYRAAFDAYGRMRAMSILQEHGQAMVDALAFLLRVRSLQPGVEADIGPSLGFTSSIDNFVKEGRMAVLFDMLKEQAMSAPNPADKIIDAVGICETAPIGRNDFLSPAMLHRIRVEEVKNRA